jgi:hypothetical protein
VEAERGAIKKGNIVTSRKIWGCIEQLKKRSGEVAGKNSKNSSIGQLPRLPQGNLCELLRGDQHLLAGHTDFIQHLQTAGQSRREWQPVHRA